MSALYWNLEHGGFDCEDRLIADWEECQHGKHAALEFDEWLYLNEEIVRI